ncbi:MAG TPA: inositol monophosphatase family protein [Thermoanaerobaculia bacterium]|nr:inositol monophosphatase family protein [Thermoanaerobaculia bacterium]
MDSSLLATAVAAAEAGGRVLLDFWGKGDLDARKKAENDFVTAADHGSEAVVVAEIRRRFPEHRFLAEEGGASGGAGDVEWLIDPLDGTANFMQGVPFFCVSVACRRQGELLAAAVLDPLRSDLFTAERGGGAARNGRRMAVSARPDLTGSFLATGYPFRAHPAIDLYLGLFREVFLQAKGIRRCGAAALDLAYTAAGVFDGFFEFRLSAWDIAAGALLIEEAGGRISDLDGGPGYLDGGNVLAGTPGVHAALRRAARRHASEAQVDSLVSRAVEVAP